MPKEVLYLKLEQNAELSGESVHISDLGKLYCKTQSVQNRCRTLPVFRFEEKDKGRRVVSALFVISLLQQDNPNLEVESIGAPETVVEQVKVSRYPGFWQVCKIVFVCCICFFGAAFTIMAFHNRHRDSRGVRANLRAFDRTGAAVGYSAGNRVFDRAGTWHFGVFQPYRWEEDYVRSDTDRSGNA